MTEIKPGETQQELFQEFSGEPKKKERFPSLHKPQKPILLTTSIEQIILVSILLILTGCFIFFLGVIRGRSLAYKSQETRFQERVRPPAAALPAGEAKPAAALPVRSTPPIIKNQAPAPPVALNLNKPYTIQLVTYKSKDLAEKEVAALRRNGFYSVIIPSGDYFQVCAGQYATKEEAKKDLKTLGVKYKDCFLRRR